jgi:hypothetical protein
MHEIDAKAGNNTLKLGWQLLGHFGHIEPKLPTPTVSDQYTDNLASTQQSPGSMHSVTSAQAVIRPDLLPTPNTMDHLPARTPEALAEAKKRSPAGFSNLRESVVNSLLPTTTASDWKGANNSGSGSASANGIATVTEGLTNTWGKFAPAIQRWEQTIGRPAPAPTLPDGKENKHRLNSAFTEWMMGLPEGWITNTGLTRAEELKACGNGVVPQQAKLALAILLEGVKW